MNLIQKYKDLNILESIIFWGIILIIILTIILVIILVIKKKKNKKEIINDTYEELPIIKEQDKEIESTKTDDIFLISNIEPKQEETINENDDLNNNLFDNVDNDLIVNNKVENEIKEESNIEKTNQQELKIEENKYKTNFEMPSAPYQRNVLREMSLSQTSPIGINKRPNEYPKKEEVIKETENKNSITKLDDFLTSREDVNPVNNQVDNVEDSLIITNEQEIYEEIEDTNQEEIIQEEPKFRGYFEENTIEKKNNNDTNNDEYSEDIERTRYEIEQEENAIISYKELMEKKDSIQTIDEEDAVISIEELLNKTNNKQEIEEESKLYNISEEEENDSFINELKQFRKDL